MCGRELNLYQIKILDRTKFKAFGDNKMNTAKLMNSLFDRLENTVGQGEKAG